MTDDSTPRRRPIPKRLRFEILRRDNHACRYCGGVAPGVKLTVDHVIPVVLGGSDDPSNLVAACVDCNAGKTSSAPDAHHVADVTADALRWARAMRVASDIARENAADLAEVMHSFDEAWLEWKTSSGHPLPRPRDWQEAFQRWLDAGLLADDIYDAIDIAMRRDKVSVADTYRYFAGICWRRLTERQQEAQRLIDEGII